MSSHTEAKLIASRPEPRAGNAAFTARTMAAVKAASTHQTFAHRLHHGHAKGWRTRLKQLPAPVFAAIVALMMLLLAGVVYASIQFTPALLRVFDKTTDSRGATEYSVAGFTACAQNASSQIYKFEVNKDVPSLSDNEVKNIIQARCELAWIDGFVAATWPTYGSHKTWQSGDTIYYARPDMLGRLQTVSASSLSLSTGQNTQTYQTPKGQTISAYAEGAKIPLQTLKSGDSVFSVVRVAETYFEPAQPQRANPRVQGIIAVIKLSLPSQYYGALQNDITEVPPCPGNPGEYCPSTASVDIFPAGSEAAKNPELVVGPHDTEREISGRVVSLADSTLTLTSRSGKSYTVTAPTGAFTTYNSQYAPLQQNFDPTLKVGSSVDVVYMQPAQANPRTISPSQIFQISLQLNFINKQSPPTQY